MSDPRMPGTLACLLGNLLGWAGLWALAYILGCATGWPAEALMLAGIAGWALAAWRRSARRR